jgi:hypothetical protein
MSYLNYEWIRDCGLCFGMESKESTSGFPGKQLCAQFGCLSRFHDLSFFCWWFSCVGCWVFTNFGELHRVREESLTFEFLIEVGMSPFLCCNLLLDYFLGFLIYIFGAFFMPYELRACVGWFDDEFVYGPLHVGFQSYLLPS